MCTWSNQKNEKDDRSEEVGSGDHTGSHHNLIETLRFTDERKLDIEGWGSPQAAALQTASLQLQLEEEEKEEEEELEEEKEKKEKEEEE